MGDSATALIPNAQAFTGAAVVARCDGLFVMQMRIDRATGLDRADLDELAYVTSMVVKAKLEHTHYHHNMPGKGRASALKPSQILVVPPVLIAPRGWATRVRNLVFDDGHAREAMSLQTPDMRALVDLRHRYVRLDDTLGFRIRSHRNTQAARLRSGAEVLSFFVYTVVLAILLEYLVLPRKNSDLREILMLGLAGFGLAWAAFFRQRISRWDVPVIRLLRTAHGFYTSANLLNRVIEAIRLDGQNAVRVDGFDDLISNFQSRLEGEQHRVAMGQNWLAFSIAAAGVVVAAAALQHPEPPETAKGGGTAAQAIISQKVNPPARAVAPVTPSAAALTNPSKAPQAAAPNASAPAERTPPPSKLVQPLPKAGDQTKPR